jgi:hypothetical protein
MRLDISQKPTSDITELSLRRLLAGELTPTEQALIEGRIATDARLRAQLKSLADEQSHFEAEISFERFAGGVARAQRDLARNRLSWKTPVLGASTMAFAAAAAFLFLSRPTIAPQGASVSTSIGLNRTKGTKAPIEVIVRIANARGEQTTAQPGKDFDLTLGDRVRLGIHLRAGGGFVAAISTDEFGSSTPVYPESGAAIRVVSTKEPTFLPDSFEFTGKGRETLFVLVAPESFDVNEASHALGSYLSARPGRERFETLDQTMIPDLKVISFPFNKP